MKVQIKTVFGEMSFDMTQENALNIINQAMKYANGASNNEPAPANRTVAHESNMAAPVKAEEKPAPRSRAEAMFGAREGWNMPAANRQQNTTPRTGGPEARGFLYVKCEKCGKVKGFLARYALNYHQCECGHKTELRDLHFAYVKCKCGKDYTYVTNMQDDFTIDCMNCGSPVDMEMGAKGTAFVTVGQKYAGGGTGKW